MCGGVRGGQPSGANAIAGHSHCDECFAVVLLTGTMWDKDKVTGSIDQLVISSADPNSLSPYFLRRM